MKTSMLLLLLIAAVMLLCCGCAVEQTIAVQNIELSGPQSCPPIHITHDSVSATRIAIHLLANTQKTINATFTNEYTSLIAPATTLSPGKVQWGLSQFEAGADINLSLTHSLALTGGASVADNHWGFNLGLGFHGGGPDAVVRLDAGFQWQSLSYVIDYALITRMSGIFGQSEQTEYLQRHETASHGDFFGALTVNSQRPVGSINFFFQAGYSHRTIYDVKTEAVVFPFFAWSNDHAVATSYIVATPGIYLDISPTVRIIAGARFVWDVGFDTSDPSLCIAPVVLFDFGL